MEQITKFYPGETGIEIYYGMVKCGIDYAKIGIRHQYGSKIRDIYRIRGISPYWKYVDTGKPIEQFAEDVHFLSEIKNERESTKIPEPT